MLSGKIIFCLDTLVFLLPAVVGLRAGVSAKSKRQEAARATSSHASGTSHLTLNGNTPRDFDE